MESRSRVTARPLRLPVTVSNPQRSLKSVINVFIYSLSVDSVVAQVVAQALASLEGQVKGSVKDYVVKVSPVIFPIYYSY